MKKKMICITILLSIVFSILLPVYFITKNAVVETLAITIGVTLYHFAMRLIVGYTVNALMKNHADPLAFWFQPRKWEENFFKLIQIRKWKKYLPTYDVTSFDPRQKSMEEILGASCQAEIVHEIIMPFSLLPIVFIPILGAPVAFILTSLFAMLFDSLFVILQRFNRPRLLKAARRFSKNQK
ncbi:MAG: hypothetical protein IJW96_00025 [Clostridia bacterium]|nr:hypothetical protein [Clostridia bacterium]